MNTQLPTGAAASRYAVAGNPVEHSQSPFIHAEFARQTGEAVAYERLPCPCDAFAATVHAFAESGASVRFDGTGWSGDNTDGAGLVRDIEANAGVALRGSRLLLIGAGGAAAGVLGPLAAAGAAEIVVANRTAARAQALVERHAAALGASTATALSARPLETCGEGFDIVINASASSVAGDAVPVSAEVLRTGALAIDMMYGPSARGFIDWAAAHGAVGRDGLGMLVEQAAESFLFWRGVRPATQAVLAALRLRLGAR